MNIGDYIIFRYTGQDYFPIYRVGKIISRYSVQPKDTAHDGNPPDTFKYVQELHRATYWTSFNRRHNGTYELMGHQVVPAPEHIVLEALLLASTGEAYTIPRTVGEKLISRYNAVKGLT